MATSEIRLELLKLTYTHARDANEAVTRAKVLEAYVMEEAPRQTLGLPPKKPGTFKAG